jgi:hypothetical protein
MSSNIRGAMGYARRQKSLRDLFSLDPSATRIPDGRCEIVNIPFVSQACRMLPGRGDYMGGEDATAIDVEGAPPGRPAAGLDPALGFFDLEVESNRSFRYPVFNPRPGERCSNALLLFHGLNERSWEKYLVWAEQLAERLDRPVLLFPIAFHMNRSPKEWNTPRLMRSVSNGRQRALPALAESSFANAAISARLQAIPQRFFFSCMQTISDTCALVDAARRGDHPLLAAGCRFDFFAYSVGAFVTEVLLLGDEEGRFADSRAVLFCGGATFDLMNPLSRYILDSEAYRTLRRFLIDRFPEEARIDPKIAPYFARPEPFARGFEMLLDSHRLVEERRRAVSACAERVLAIALEQDDVAHPDAIEETLESPGVRIDRRDFPYPYRHENPFPAGEEIDPEVDAAFDDVISTSAAWLAGTSLPTPRGAGTTP